MHQVFNKILHFSFRENHALLFDGVDDYVLLPSVKDLQLTDRLFCLNIFNSGLEQFIKLSLYRHIIIVHKCKHCSVCTGTLTDDSFRAGVFSNVKPDTLTLKQILMILYFANCLSLKALLFSCVLKMFQLSSFSFTISAWIMLAQSYPTTLMPVVCTTDDTICLYIENR